MKLLLFISLFLISFSSVWSAEKFLNFGDKKFAKEKTEKGKWFIKNGLEYIKYRSTFPAFKGKHEDFKKNEEEDIFGYGLSFGREVYFGAGISSSISIGGFYSKTLNKELGQAAENIDLEIANIRRGHQILNYEGLLSLNYLFDNKVVDIQPFIEGAIGVGSAKVEKEYRRRPVENAAAAENYNVVTEENYAYTKISLGLNVILFNGLTSFFKVSSTLMNINERKTVGNSNIFGTTSVVDHSNKEKKLDESVTMTMASIGMGYMF